MISGSLKRDTMNDNRKRTPPSRTQRKREQIAKFNPGLIPRFTFNTFVVGQSNLMAFNAAQLVAGTVAYPYSPLVIHGDAGVGKTHLLHAIGNHIMTTHSKAVSVVTAEAFTNDYITALQNRELTQFRARHRKVDALLMDAIQFLSGKERMQEQLLYALNALHDTGKLVVVTADRPLHNIAGMEARLVSRLEAGLCLGIDHPDRETCITILRRKLDAMDASIPEDCLAYIATVAGYSGRTLEGALIRATSYRMLSGKELTLPILKRQLKDFTDKKRKG
jgi:chromosomal replication initiator protein